MSNMKTGKPNGINDLSIGDKVFTPKYGMNGVVVRFEDDFARVLYAVPAGGTKDIASRSAILTMEFGGREGLPWPTEEQIAYFNENSDAPATSAPGGIFGLLNMMFGEENCNCPRCQAFRGARLEPDQVVNNGPVTLEDAKPGDYVYHPREKLVGVVVGRAMAGEPVGTLNPEGDCIVVDYTVGVFTKQKAHRSTINTMFRTEMPMTQTMPA